MMMKMEKKKVGVDGINCLSDDVLVLIISKLDPVEAVRTSTLSRQWRNLWNSMPSIRTCHLNLDLEHHINHGFSQHGNSIDGIDRLLSSYPPGPILSCRFRYYSKFGDSCIDSSSSHFEGWMVNLTDRGIRELILYDWKASTIPACLLYCKTLRVLRLRNCKLYPHYCSLEGCFANLKTVELSRTELSDDLIQGMISNCVFLESLKLESCIGFNAIKYHGQNLKHLELAYCDLESLTVDSPNLTSVEVICCDIGVISIHSQNLKSLKLDYDELIPRHPSHVMVFKLSGGSKESSCRAAIASNRLSSIHHSLRRLVITVNFKDPGPSVLAIAHLLKSCPCLQGLNVSILDDAPPPSSSFASSSSSSASASGNWGTQESFDCLTHHLETVELKNFAYHSNSLGFATFLVAKALKLKRMTIHHSNGFSDKDHKAVTHLLLSQKGSEHAEIVFKGD